MNQSLNQLNGCIKNLRYWKFVQYPVSPCAIEMVPQLLQYGNCVSVNQRCVDILSWKILQIVMIFLRHCCANLNGYPYQLTQAAMLVRNLVLRCILLEGIISKFLQIFLEDVVSMSTHASNGITYTNNIRGTNSSVELNHNMRCLVCVVKIQLRQTWKHS